MRPDLIAIVRHYDRIAHETGPLNERAQAPKVDIMDEAARAYIDAKTDAVRAQNDARFAEVLATLKSIQSTSITWKGVWGAAAATTATIGGLLLATLSIGGDRFDGGMTARGVVSAVLDEQKARDDAQDARFDEVLKLLSAINDRLDTQPASNVTPAAPGGAISED